MPPQQRRVQDGQQVRDRRWVRRMSCRSQVPGTVNRIARVKLNFLIDDLGLLKIAPILNRVLNLVPFVGPRLSSWPVAAGPVLRLWLQLLAVTLQMLLEQTGYASISMPRRAKIIHSPAHSASHRSISCPRRNGLMISCALRVSGYKGFLGRQCQSGRPRCSPVHDATTWLDPGNTRQAEHRPCESSPTAH